MLMDEAAKDVRSVTGSLRNVMLLLGKNSIDEVKVSETDSLNYLGSNEENSWKVAPIREIVETKAGNLDIPGFDSDELETILHYLCTN